MAKEKKADHLTSVECFRMMEKLVDVISPVLNETECIKFERFIDQSGIEFRKVLERMVEGDGPVADYGDMNVVPIINHQIQAEGVNLKPNVSFGVEVARWNIDDVKRIFITIFAYDNVSRDFIDWRKPFTKYTEPIKRKVYCSLASFTHADGLADPFCQIQSRLIAEDFHLIIRDGTFMDEDKSPYKIRLQCENMVILEEGMTEEDIDILKSYK